MDGLFFNYLRAAADSRVSLFKIPSGAIIVKAGKLRPNPQCLGGGPLKGRDEIMLEVIAVLLYKQFGSLAGLYLITHCRLIQFLPYLPAIGARAGSFHIYETRNSN